MLINKDILYPSGHYFSAKEFTFLSSDPQPEQEAYLIPETYLSDMILQPDTPVISFIKSFEGSRISEHPFTCAVIKIFCEDILQADIEKILIEYFGISGIAGTSKTHSESRQWETLEDQTVIFAMEGAYKTLSQKLDVLQNALSIKFGCPVSVGCAEFPCLAFPPCQTMGNALKAFDHAAFFKPGRRILFNDVTLNISGDRLYQMGMFQDAVNDYKNGLKINPENINLMNSLGVCFSIMNQLDMARQTFEQALKIDGTDVMAAYNTGLVCDFMDDPENAVKYLKQASKLNNGIYEVELTSGIFMFKSGLFQDAKKHLKKALTLNTDSTMAPRILGEIYLKTSMPKKAESYYKMAIKGNPRDAAALSGLARAYEIQNKNLEIALDLAAHSLLLAPDNPVFRMRIGKIYLKKGLYDTAGKEFAKAENALDALEMTMNEGFKFKQPDVKLQSANPFNVLNKDIPNNIDEKINMTNQIDMTEKSMSKKSA